MQTMTRRSGPPAKKPRLAAGLTALLATTLSSAAVAVANPQADPASGTFVGVVPGAVVPPTLRVQTLIDGLAIPWDLTFTSDGTMLVTERTGRTLARLPNGTVQTVATNQADLWTGVESGLMGIVVDPAFATNRQYYTCQAYRGSGTTPVDIRVVRWTLSAGATSATRLGSPVVTGLPISSGRHGGCRLRFATDGTLHVGTGDAAIGTNPQDLGSLGGKTLRVASDGSVPAGNPFAAQGGRAALVWTYGHRNVQGLATRPGTSEMWQVEQGTDRDDEVNLLVRGANYGWDPVPGYDESTPMTDLAKYSTAQRARWSSGYPTVATSGATFLNGSEWGTWEGALAVAELKGSGVRVLLLTPDGRVRAQTQMAALDNTVGRIRTVQLGPDRALYLTTSNGTGDKVLRVTPAPPASAPYRPGLDVSPSGAAVARRGASVTAFVRGTNGRLYATSQATPDAGWTDFSVLPVGPVASAPAAVSWGGSRIDVFARGTNNHLVHTWTDGSGWAAWQDLGGEITTAPGVTSTGSGELDVVARGTNDALYHRRWAAGRWSPWHALGGVLTSTAALSVSAADQVTATARGRDGRLYDAVVGSGGLLRGWRSLGRTSTSAPASGTTGPLLSRNDSTPVMVLGTAGMALGGELTGAPAAALRSDASPLVVGRGVDDALWSWDGRPGHQSWSRVGGALS